jgi:hypothetical protein
MNYSNQFIRGTIFGFGFSVAVLFVFVAQAIAPGVVKNPIFGPTANDVVSSGGGATCSWTGWYCDANPCGGDWINSDNLSIVVMDAYCDVGSSTVTDVRFAAQSFW